MTIALTAALILTLTGFLWLLDRRDKRDRTERASWLQRIQNPQAAVHEHHAQVTPPAPAASPLPMTDEEIAEMQANRIPDGQSELAQIIARMEAAENGTAQIEDGLIP
jgi:hypothetical protein